MKCFSQLNQFIMLVVISFCTIATVVNGTDSEAGNSISKVVFKNLNNTITQNVNLLSHTNAVINAFKQMTEYLECCVKNREKLSNYFRNECMGNGFFTFGLFDFEKNNGICELEKFLHDCYMYQILKHHIEKGISTPENIAAYAFVTFEQDQKASIPVLIAKKFQELHV